MQTNKQKTVRPLLLDYLGFKDTVWYFSSHLVILQTGCRACANLQESAAGKRQINIKNAYKQKKMV